MFKRFNVSFRNWVLGTTTLLVGLLTAAFLVTLVGSFARISEENAITQFSLIARQASTQLATLLNGNARFVTTQARADLGQFVVGGQINPQEMVSTLISSLEADDNTYSHHFGLANDEFLQVIAIRDDARIRQAIDAPAAAAFAVRRITRTGSGGRQESWQFLDGKRRHLARKDKAAGFSPTSRPWYRAATQRGNVALTEPYLFSSTGQLGITVSTPLPENAGVLATDLSLHSLQAFLSRLSLSANAAILIQDNAGRVLAFHGRGARFASLSPVALSMVESLGSPYFRFLQGGNSLGEASIARLGDGADNEKFVVTEHRTEPLGGQAFRVVVLAPLTDFSEPFMRAERNVLLVSGLMLLLLLPLALIGSRHVSRSLVTMAVDSERIKQLDFSGKPHEPDTFLYEIRALGEAQVVMQEAIRRRTEALELAQNKLASLVDNGLLLSREQDRTVLLKHILFGARDIAQCAAATLYLKTEQNTLVFALRTSDDALPAQEIPLFEPITGAPNERYVVTWAALHNQTVIIDDVYSETRFDLSGTRRFSEDSGFRTVSMLTVPLSPREGEVIGLIQLLNAQDPATGEVIPFHPDIVGYVEALAAQSAVALENQHLLEAQKALMDSLIKIIAGAIDAKSAYTGGHCERVPELAVMLAEVASQATTGGLADFSFKTDDEWREFRIGAWLHDCGKVTTPEYVVDKATKLETIYNRIHEIRTRFEVLLRDAQIARLEAIIAGAPESDADARFSARQQQLLDDYAFVAECNVGGEFMAQERIERIRQIGAQHWVRHFDDRLGLGNDELMRYADVVPVPAPATETLLADQPWHVVPRLRNAEFDAKYGFKVNVPANLYNFGELYNLAIARGTLTEEERFKINEHIIQTVIMLDQMPFPKHLRRVPEYAATHHETMIGTGYPRRLDASSLSIPSRIMAIADIFEALTASDRPYKKGKTLSEAIKILYFFKKDKHIDPELFDLFLTSGAYLTYGRRFLRPEQIDEVDISRFIG